MASMTVITSVYFLLQQNRNRSTQGQSGWTYKSFEGITYNTKRYSNWCDVNNGGVTHFGVEPSLLP
eukprot:13031287-Ditylum_brightwellii.AAC.1